MIDTHDAVDLAAMPAGVEWEGYVRLASTRVSRRPNRE